MLRTPLTRPPHDTLEPPPPGDPSEAEAFRVLFGGVVMARGGLLLELRPVAPEGDRFNPDRVGLDHLSFSAASRDDPEQAFGIHMPYEDPDGIQLKLAAPAGQPAPRG